MKKIRLAIIGNGLISHAHAAGFRAIEGVEIAACCDIIEEKAKSFAGQYGIPAYYTDFTELLDKEKPDAVSIATPDAVHAAMATEALKRGVHTFSEKPLSSDLEGAAKMNEAACEAAGKGIMTGVNFPKRVFPCSQKMAEMVCGGELGRVLRFEARYRQSWRTTDCWGESSKNPAFQWRLSKKHGLGCIGDIGVHVFDLTSYVCGDFEGLFCCLDCYDLEPRKAGGYVFDANEAMHSVVRLKNGITGAIHTARTDTGFVDEVSLIVFCENGALDLNQAREADKMLLVCRGENRNRAVWEPVECPPVPDNYRSFIDSVKSGKQGRPSFAEGYKVQKYVDAGFRSAET
ncbi:MAG: Gfo/Idh/MocA family oxidoreductase, partial [Abditibacteriota bacterium]|nr:Gfo/Idh/MocA family oxidoreductase [Abditibacteriota bacterium]